MIRFKLIRFFAAISMMAVCLFGHAQDHAAYLQQVQRSGVTLTLISTKSPSNIGDGTAVVLKVSGSGVLPPSGTIVFSAMQTNMVTGTAVSTTVVTLDPSGNAAWVFTLPAGTYQFLASYSGDANYQPSDANPLAQTVIGPADFTLALDSESLVVKQGSTWTGSITATSVNNFQGIVTLTCNGSNSVAYVNCLPGQPLVLSAGGSTKFPIQVTTIATTLNVLSSGVFIFCFGIASKKRRLQKMMSLSLLSLLLLFVGCGSVRYEQRDGTPKGDYKMTFTGQSGALSHAVSFTLSVQ